MRLAGVIKGGYYPTPPRCVDLISNFIEIEDNPRNYVENQDDILRILDPCCGPGEACEGLAENLAGQTESNIQTFGVELEENRALMARDLLDFTLSADIFQTQISNRSFHILFLNPPYDFDQEEKRMEQAFLNHATRFLETDGLLVLIVPKHRLEVSARFIAAHYSQVNCRAFPMPQYDDFDQVVLFGRRLLNPVMDQELESRIIRWSRGPLEEMDTLADPGSPFVVKPSGRRNLIFNTRTVDPQRAARETRRTGLWANQNLRDRLWPIDTPKNQPLMPLRQGHMAMLIAAGFLDNLLLEANGRRVIVKGKTIKRRELLESNEREDVWQDRMYTTIRTLDLDTGIMENVETKTGSKVMEALKERETPYRGRRRED